MKHHIILASAATVTLAIGWTAAAALAEEGYEGIPSGGLPFEQVVEGPVCNPVHTESGGVVVQGDTNVPATSSGSYICGQQASLPPATMPATAMPGPSKMEVGERHTLPDIYFSLGSAWLTDRAIAQVDYFTYYDVIKTPVQSIHITGYADDQGSAESNLRLSKRRAEAVAAYMETKGIRRSHMIITGAGAVAGGISAANRRVEVTAE